MNAREKDSGRWSDRWCLLLTFPELFRLVEAYSLFLTRISCRKTTHANSYYGAWPGWVVSVSVFPLTVLEYTSKAMAPHSSTLAWKIPWAEEPGRLQSMGSRVRLDWATSLSLFTFMHWRRKWRPTPVFLPGESQGQGSLMSCCLWGRTESDTTEAT